MNGAAEGGAARNDETMIAKSLTFHFFCRPAYYMTHLYADQQTDFPVILFRKRRKKTFDPNEY